MFAIAEHSAASLDDGENETYTCERIMRKVVEKNEIAGRSGAALLGQNLGHFAADRRPWRAAGDGRGGEI